jgi:hypothetical protein
LQALFSAMLLLFISLTTIPVVTIQSEAQSSSVSGEEMLLDNNLVSFFLDAFEYTFDINGAQIFPNDTIKNSVVTEYNASVYNIPSLQYKIMDHIINASDVQVYVNPTRIDEQNTRVDFQIYANNAEVVGQWLNKSYTNLEIKSAYGIHNLATDKMTIHIPYSVALQHLLK